MAPTIEAAGAEAPLLQGGPRKIPSLAGAVFNVATTIIGAGIMSIPATLKVLGIIPAFFMIVFIGIIVEISVEFMLRFTYSGDARTYAGLMGESFGRWGAVAVQICVMITNLGCLIMYLIIIGDVLSGTGADHLGVLQEWFGVQWWNIRAVALLFIVVFVMLPLLLYRRLESLWLSSAISVVLAIVFVGICSGMAIAALIQGQTQTPRFLPDLEGGLSFFNLFTAVPVIVTAYTFHFNVHPIGVELGKPSDMMSAVRIALIFCAAIYFAIGVFGYLLFGEATMDDILVNFDKSSGSSLTSLLNDLVRLSYALHLMLVFPMLNFSLRTNIDEFLFSKRPHLTVDNKRFLLLTLTLLALAYILAIAIPSIWYLFQFMGSTSAVCLAFIFPGAVALRDIHGISTGRDKIIAAIMISLAVITSCIAISTNIYNMVV
ncbi:Transmembrane amino acid transporter family protein [Perilla frutescens var. hirtella]|uniref:Transmembrane amino acid transporter family protein n=1 Tax=Perilla frutescens var. hirtella TaxID=608512 RepID=A0AAD4JP39_PERFH|nr:Transmembrane amino acid transporter family protein [Perilla frutescens var. hirtella]